MRVGKISIKLSAPDEFLFHVKHLGACAPTPEHSFHERRKWRFDFAWPEEKIAVEIEGVTTGGWRTCPTTGRKIQCVGRHQTPAGYARDCEKYNEAGLAGWRVFRFTQTMIRSGQAERLLKRLLAAGELAKTDERARQQPGR